MHEDIIVKDAYRLLSSLPFLLLPPLFTSLPPSPPPSFLLSSPPSLLLSSPPCFSVLSFLLLPCSTSEQKLTVMAPVLLTGLNKIVDQPEEVSVEGVRV